MAHDRYFLPESVHNSTISYLNGKSQRPRVAIVCKNRSENTRKFAHLVKNQTGFVCVKPIRGQNIISSVQTKQVAEEEEPMTSPFIDTCFVTHIRIQFTLLISIAFYALRRAFCYF